MRPTSRACRCDVDTPKRRKMTVQHTLAEWKNQAQVGGLIARTVVTVHVMMFHMPFVAVLRRQLSLYVDQMSLYKPSEWIDCESHLATRHLSRNRERRTVSFTRRTHWRNDARTSATRTLCAQHRCRPQGGGQGTTALVADLIISKVQLCQRRIGLVKIARTCHGAARSTHLTDVDHHVSAMTLDAKLIELLHFLPCSAGRALCGHRKRTSTVVLLCHVMA